MKKWRLHLLCVLFCGTAVAENLAIGNYERMVVNVPEGTTNRLTESVLVAPMAASLEKTGKGTWTVPLSGVVGGGAPVRIGVTEGTVRITEGAVPAGVADPPAVAQAALWLKAGVNLNVITQTNGTTGVSHWLDAREASLSGTVYPRAIAVSCFTNSTKEVLYPLFPTESAASGHPAVYFGKRGEATAAWMCLFDGQGKKTNIPLYHLFLAHSVSNSWQAPFSSVSDPNPFFVDNMATAITRAQGPRYLSMYTAQPLAYSMFAYRNGILFDASIQQITTSLTGLQTLEYQLCGNPGKVNALFNDRNYSTYQGGDYICEALLFTNRLSSAERLQISDYLVRKYTQRAVSPVVFDMAEDTTIEVESDVFSCVTLPPPCTLRKVGGNDLWYSMLYGKAIRGVQVDDGALCVETANLPYVFRPGEAISISTNAFGYRVTRSKDALPTEAVVSAGGAVITVDRLKKDVKALTVRDGTLVLSGPSSVSDRKHVNVPVVDSASIALTGTETTERPVDFPEDGTYELSFKIRKTGSGNEPHLCDIGFRTGDNLSNFSRVIAFDTTALTRRFLCRDMKAGVHTLVFTGRDSRSSLISDLRLDPVRPETETVFPVPNGDFERVALPAYDTYATNNTAEGWTFQQMPNTGKKVGGVGVVYSGFKGSAFSGNLAAARYGEVQLVFYHTNAVASSDAFKIPAGTWKLRAKAMNWGTCTVNWDGSETAKRCNSGGILRASVVINGGSPTVLGSWTAAGRYWTSVTFSIPFTVTEGDTVSVCLDQTKDHGSVLADEIELVKVTAADAELVQNGSFISSQGAWNFCSPITDEYGKMVAQYVTLVPGWFGSWQCDDAYAVRVANRGFLTQSITFPEAGLYRLRFWVRGRYPDGGDTTFPATHVLKAWLTQDGMTNTILPFAPATTTNFFEHTVLFEIPDRENMTWDIGIGGVKGGDAALDCVSIRKASEDEELVQNGSFVSSQMFWTLFNGDTDEYGKKVAQYVTLAPGWFGSWQCDDPYAVRVANQGALTQAITFPEAGVYRLRLWARGRHADGGDTTLSEKHILKAWLAQDGTTNTVLPCILAATTNFIEHTALFEIPNRENMTWDIGIGGVKGGDAALDCVSIKRASLDVLPEVSPDTSLNLEGNSSAVLAFSGTLELDQVRIGGRTRSGFISAEQFPDVLSGPGVFYVAPRASVILLR